MSEKVYPAYRKASYAGEYAVQENGKMRVVWYKRLSGWGYAEIFTAEGKLMAVLDYLGEVLVRDQEIPMRIEAQEYRLEETEQSLDMVFEVSSMNVQSLLDGTSFAPWMHYPFVRPVLEGTVRVSLDRNSARLSYSMRLKARENMYMRYLRGPWLKVGAGSFGTDKTDALLPGVDWVTGKEWSSGNDWFKYPWSEKFAPLANKVTAPCMSISHEGDAIGLSWDPNMWGTRWFNYRKHMLQPVFAVPNFVDRDDNCLMGLMLPQAEGLKDENQLYAEPPLEVHLEEQFRIDAEIFLVKGNCSDALSDYVIRHGLPELPEMERRETYENVLRKICYHLNTNLWKPDRGFGYSQHNSYSFNVPGYVRKFVEMFPDDPSAQGLREKIAECDRRTGRTASAEPPKERTPEELAKVQAERAAALVKRANDILKDQRADGTFRFEPDGRHWRKDDFTVARVFAEPMGIGDDTALDMNMLPAIDLLHIAEELRSLPGGAAEAERIGQLALKAVDSCENDTRPEGGDFWETPLHAANLFAAGHAAVACYRAYTFTGIAKYKEKAVYWIRTLLPFTHLWQPADIEMLYNTKPCLCSSDWYFANWVRDDVQWEVLAVFSQSAGEGIKWWEVDPEIDWQRYQQGVTLAAARWMIDHTLDRWMPHNIPSTYEAYARGEFDGCFPDTFNTCTGNYGGMAIFPSAIADNIMTILGAHDLK